jgi:streptogramin lyase
MRALRAIVPISCALLLSGCSVAPVLTSTSTGSFPGTALRGMVHGGQGPIVGAHVYLYAINTTGYGGAGIPASSSNASVSLLTSTTGNPADGNGNYYVTTDANGNFKITSDYICPSAYANTYYYAAGGNPGTGANSAVVLVGPAPACTSSAFTVVNEVSTIATIYAFAGFISDPLHVSSSGSTLAETARNNASGTLNNLYTLGTGVALATTPAGNGTVPQAEINTLANILAACVNSSGPLSTQCTTLFDNAENGSTPATDTATAAINIAHNPVANIAALYALSTATPPFEPALTAQPNDFTISLSFTAGGSRGRDIAIDADGDVWTGDIELSNSGSVLSGASGYTAASLNYPYGMAIDQSGDAWVTNFDGNSVTKFSSTGSNLSGTNGYTGTLDEPNSVAIDAAGNAWVTSYDLLLTKFSSTGSELSPSFEGYNGGGILEPAGVAIDGSGEVWVANDEILGRNPTPAIAVFSNTGTALTGNGITGGGLSSPEGIAVDASGNAWVADYAGLVVEINNSGTIVSGTGGFTPGGLAGPEGIAIDGAGNVWVSNFTGYGIVELSNSGATLSGPNGFTSGRASGSGSTYVAIDGSGNVWAPYSGGIFEIVGAAVPVITPICAGLPSTLTANGTSNLGTRP